MRSDLAYIAELFAGIGPVRFKAMFGAHGVYCGELFFAVIADGEVYLKVDRETEHDFTGAGCAPFVYRATPEPVAMSYWSVPAEAMDSAEAMTPWARLALDAAARKALAKKPRARKKRD